MPRTCNGRGAAAVVAVAITAAGLAACGGSAPPLLPSQTSATEAAESTPTAPPTPTPTATVIPPQDIAEAQAVFRGGDYEAAATAFEALAQEAGGSERAEALLGLAVSRQAAGDIAGAITAAGEAAEAGGDSATGIHARYLEGRYLADSGEFPAATAILAALADRDMGVLKSYVLADLQRAALGANDAALADLAAARLAIEQGVPAALAESAIRQNVAAALAAGDTARYIAELERLAERTGYARDRFELAVALGNAGRDAERIDLLQRIVAETPSDPFAAVAVDALEAAGETVNPSRKGFIYYRAHRYVEAVAALTPVVEARAALPPDDQAFATFYLAAAHEDQGNYAEAVALYDQVPSLAPQSPYAHRARYWSARMMEALNELGSASARYVELVNTAPAGEFSEEAAFRAGYVLYRSGDPAGAVSAWTALGEVNARVLFWRGVAQEALGDTAAAQASFAAAVAAGPLDFHGLEAAARTSTEPPLAPVYTSYDLAVTPDWDYLQTWVAENGGGTLPIVPLDSERAATLASLGLRAEAEEAVYDLVPAGVPPVAILAAARVAHELGLESTAARLGERLRLELGVRWSEAPPDLLRLGYPVDFPALLDAEARSAGLDPLFLAALIRTESFWEPSAVSPVGALGLTQVMPTTGEGIAAALEVPDFRVDSLLRPATSLKFGAWYVAEQIEAFGHPFAALAAYNGGPGRAARWLELWDGASAASFAETVDIEETRNYVELVLEAYARYKAAYPEIAR